MVIPTPDDQGVWWYRANLNQHVGYHVVEREFNEHCYVSPGSLLSIVIKCTYHEIIRTLLHEPGTGEDKDMTRQGNSLGNRSK